MSDNVKNKKIINNKSFDIIVAENNLRFKDENDLFEIRSQVLDKNFNQ